MKTCSGCDTARPNAWFARSSGEPYKSCKQCRKKNRERAANRRGVALGLNKTAQATECADCGRALTPNRTVRLGGECIFYGCQRKRFGVER